MAERIEGGRTRVGGLSLSEPEGKIIDRARKLKGWSRAEFMRAASLLYAAEVEAEEGVQLVKPEEYDADPELMQVYLRSRASLQRVLDRPPARAVAPPRARSGR